MNLCIHENALSLKQRKLVSTNSNDFTVSKYTIVTACNSKLIQTTNKINKMQWNFVIRTRRGESLHCRIKANVASVNDSYSSSVN